MNQFKNVFGRMYVVYALAGLVFMAFNFEAMYNQAKLKTLNRLMPPLEELVRSGVQGQALTPSDLDAYRFYYGKVSEYMPANANAHYVRAYCLILEGRTELAVEAFGHSIELNPHFFWSHYNLGLIHLKNEQPDLAAESFRKALEAKPDVSLKIMLSSKVFQQLLLQLPNSGEVLTKNIKRGYADTQKLLALSEHLKKQPEKSMPEPLRQQLPAKLF